MFKIELWKIISLVLNCIRDQKTYFFSINLSLITTDEKYKHLLYLKIQGGRMWFAPRITEDLVILYLDQIKDDAWTIVEEKSLKFYFNELFYDLKMFYKIESEVISTDVEIILEKTITE